MVKAGIPPSISKETVRRVLQKTDQHEMDSFSEKRNIDQKWLIILLEKFVVNVQCNYMKYEIIKKPMIIERVKVNLLKSAHYC